ncbi:MAG: zinc finger domain-containing protein [Nanoarchaeota archaeon]|nr:zinc finger domain-containing protein [Nanoarchaeota archaeon]
MAENSCTSCKRKITNMVGSTSYKCPNCGKHDVFRCTDCRIIASRYTCPACSFSGPN